MRHLYAVGIFLLLCINANAQKLTSSLIHPAGTIVQNNEINMHWAIGELAVSRTSNQITLDQGLYQLNPLNTFISKTKPLLNIDVYPNPAIDQLHINRLIDDSNFVIYALNGANVNNGIITKNAPFVNIHSLNNGLYTIRISTYNGATTTLKFLKTN